MPRKIICSECETLLQEGDDPAEFKKCIDCVLRTTPAADMSKLVDSTGRTFESKMAKQKKPPKLQSRMDNVMKDGEDYPVPITLFLLTDYEKTHEHEFALDFYQVKEMYETMCEMNRQNKEIIDAQNAGLKGDGTPEDTLPDDEPPVQPDGGGVQ